jgi:hypothetical protein
MAGDQRLPADGKYATGAAVTTYPARSNATINARLAHPDRVMTDSS